MKVITYQISSLEIFLVVFVVATQTKFACTRVCAFPVEKSPKKQSVGVYFLHGTLF